MAADGPIPFTVIGGFLGAGKTTLLNRVLAGSHGVRYAVLVNDFGALNVDADLIVAHGGETIALANGCICCSIGDSLIDTLVALMARPDPADHILVEASGVSDPARIADIARIDPALSLDGIVVLADAAAIRQQLADRFVGETVAKQLDCADLLLLNKTDLLDAPGQQSVIAALGERWPEARLLPVSQAEVPLDLLLGAAPATDGSRTTPSLGHDHDHGDHEAEFRRAELADVAFEDRETLERALAALPESVLRAKGFVRLQGSTEGVVLVQRVGARTELAALTDRDTADLPNRLVFIGAPDMPDAGGLAICLGLAEPR